MRFIAARLLPHSRKQLCELPIKGDSSSSVPLASSQIKKQTDILPSTTCWIICATIICRLVKLFKQTINLFSSCQQSINSTILIVSYMSGRHDYTQVSVLILSNFLGVTNLTHVTNWFSRLTTAKCRSGSWFCQVTRCNDQTLLDF